MIPSSASFAIAASVVITGLMLLRFRRTNVLAIVAAYYFLTAYGPIINLKLGAPIYMGTRLSEVGPAAVGFAYALVGFLIADLILPQRKAFDRQRLLDDIAGHGFRRYRAALWAASIFMMATIASASSLLVTGNKTEKVQALAGHYIILFVEAALLLAYFAVESGRDTRVAYYANATVYTLYCVLSDERDFLFVLFAILVHRALLAGRVISTKAVALGSIAVLMAGLLVSLRSDTAFDLAGILNQGSLLFVDTFVRSLVPSNYPFQHGATYVDSLHNILPFGLGSNGAPNLSEWLVNAYAPGANTGYGFSLSTEAYMNFGLLGIPVVFAILGLIQRITLNAMDRRLLGAYASMVYVFALMYSVRGDSSQLLKTILYAAVIYAVLIGRLRPHGRNSDTSNSPRRALSKSRRPRAEVRWSAAR